MIYQGESTSQISFPLGGIGAGCIGLAGNGRLIDWEIFNKPSKNSTNGMSHFAVKAEKDGRVLDARILQGDLPPPYTGNSTTSDFGFGPDRNTLCGMPHFTQHVFKGEYPLAHIAFSDPVFPGAAELLAWSPFIPGNDHDSSLPAACFEITLTNTAAESIDYTVIGVVANPFPVDTAFNQVIDGQLRLNSGGDPKAFPYGELALTCEDPDLSFQEYWYHGSWCDDLEVYWNDLTQPGRFKNRHYETTAGHRNTGLLAAHFHLAPKETRTVRFILTWNIPNRTNDWNAISVGIGESSGIANRWQNWYATQWASASDSGNYLRQHYAHLRAGTLRFHDALFASTLPPEVLDGISANLAVLKSPTCLRLEDGTFYGWEGVASNIGSCEGSCTHVWNYAQALPFLFPSLERSMRSANYRFSIDENGGSHFRIMLPLGIKATPAFHRPCVDGQYGDVMKTWRDWKISGDTGWLRDHWAAIRSTIEYAWSAKNPDRWDPEKTGVITGRQHHTLDVELFGPNAWLNGHYLGALKAAAEMADALDDPAFAAECRALFANGKAWTDTHLFNGEYYHQQIDLTDDTLFAPYLTHDANLKNGYWTEEHKQFKYQIGDGCEIDMHLPQWYATLYGLGEILDPDKTRKTLQSIYKYNFKPSMRLAPNTWRNYCLNDEAGLMICSWPNAAHKPVIPIPYATECMHGFEWAAACHMIMVGMHEEGMQIIRSIRARYDGRKRNPWNEIECGSNYARSMASYALLHAFSGFTFDLTRGHLGFSPLHPGEFRCFWSLGTAWGEYHRTPTRQTLEVHSGTLHLHELALPGASKQLLHNGQPLSNVTHHHGCYHFAQPIEMTASTPSATLIIEA